MVGKSNRVFPFVCEFGDIDSAIPLRKSVVPVRSCLTPSCSGYTKGLRCSCAASSTALDEPQLCLKRWDMSERGAIARHFKYQGNP